MEAGRVVDHQARNVELFDVLANERQKFIVTPADTELAGRIGRDGRCIHVRLVPRENGEHQ
jgi:hypothetical protein